MVRRTLHELLHRPEAAIDKQILYTVGQLNGFNSVGRLDQVKIGDVTFEPVESGCFITYTAVMPVAWGYRSDAPKTFELILPRDVSYAGQEKIVSKYTKNCLDWGAHDVDAGVFWYYYRPNKSRCEMADEDIVRLEATVSPSAEETEGKYPEYHKVWEDDALNVIAIFGMAKEGGSARMGARGYTRLSTSEEGARRFGSICRRSRRCHQGKRIRCGDSTDDHLATLADGRTVSRTPSRSKV